MINYFYYSSENQGPMDLCDVIFVKNLQSVVPSCRHELVRILWMICDAENAIGVSVNLARAQTLLEE